MPLDLQQRSTPPRLATRSTGAIVVGIVGFIFWSTVDPGSLALRLLQVAHLAGYLLVIMCSARLRYATFFLTMTLTLSGWALGLTQEPFVVASWALYRATFLTERRRYFAQTVSIVSAMLLVLLLGGRPPSSEVLLLRLLTSAMFLFGAGIIGAQRRAESDQRDQAARARERAKLLEQRAEVSRELHDVLSHTLSRIGLQAGVASEVNNGDSEKTVRALRSIEAESRRALMEVRDVLTAVRGANAERDAPTAPTIAALDSLAYGSRDGGVVVTGSIDLPGGRKSRVDGHLYRIVQELVTNIGKHGASPKGELAIWVEGDDLLIHSENEIRLGGDRAEPGLGLIGIRERVGLLGGACGVSLESGLFAVDITIPASAVVSEDRDE